MSQRDDKREDEMYGSIRHRFASFAVSVRQQEPSLGLDSSSNMIP